MVGVNPGEGGRELELEPIVVSEQSRAEVSAADSGNTSFAKRTA